MEIILVPSADSGRTKIDGLANFETSTNSNQLITNAYDSPLSDEDYTSAWLRFSKVRRAVKFSGLTVKNAPPNALIVESMKLRVNIENDTWNLGYSWFEVRVGDTPLGRLEFNNSDELKTWREVYEYDLPEDKVKALKRADLDNLNIVFSAIIDSPDNIGGNVMLSSVDLVLGYTPLHEVRIPTTNFIAPFKNEPITYSTADSYAWNITKAYSLPDEDNNSAELIFPNGKVGDGYFCGFDISSIPEYSPIFEAYFKIKVATNSRNSNRYYKAYTSDAELSSVSIPNVDDTYIIPIPKPKRELLQDIRLVLEAQGYQSNSFDNVYGVELYVAYGDPMYDWVAGYPTDWKADPNNQYGAIYPFANMCDEPDTLETYATYNNGSNQYSPIAFNATLINFAYPTLSSDARIKKVRFRTSFSGSKDTTLAYDYYKFRVYLDNIKICESQSFNMSTLPLENYLTPIYVTIASDELNLKYSDISRLKVEIAQNQSFGSTNKVRFYGAALDLLALNGNARPEWYPIIDTIVKSGNLTLDFTAAKPSNDVVVNEVPETQGYIGNLYNDDLSDYAEFSYTPVPDENGVMPEDKPEFETTDLGVIRIDSPKLSSLGIPDNAAITNIKLTKESLKYCTKSNVSAELSLYINDNKYNTRGFSISTDFVKTTYDTGVISIPKADIRNDVAYFMLKWNSLNTPFTFKVKYLLWDITYDLGGLKYTVQVADGEIKQITVGNTKASSLYKGKEKLF